MNAPVRFSTAPQSAFLTVHAALGISPMDHLFNRLDGAYPHKWRSAFQNQQAIENWKESWAESFEEEGLTFADIKQGIKNCRHKYDWPPSITEFVKACRPSVDPLVAYYEAVNGIQARDNGLMGEWSHASVYWAAVKIGAFDLKNHAYSAIKVRWEKALADEMEKGQWPEIPTPMLALPEPGKTLLSREEADRRIQELKADEIVKKASSKTDHKAWATKILERAAKGDKTLSMIQIRFAKEALAAKDAA